MVLSFGKEPSCHTSYHIVLYHALSNLVYMPKAGELELGHLYGPFQPEPLYDSLIPYYINCDMNNPENH